MYKFADTLKTMQISFTENICRHLSSANLSARGRGLFNSQVITSPRVEPRNRIESFGEIKSLQVRRIKPHRVHSSCKIYASHAITLSYASPYRIHVPLPITSRKEMKRRAFTSLQRDRTRRIFVIPHTHMIPFVLLSPRGLQISVLL